MAFETGVSTSPSDLLSKLVTRLTTDGWTIVRTNGSPGAQVTIQDTSATAGTFFSFLADNTAASANLSGQPHVADGGSGVAYYAHTGSPSSGGAVGTTVSMGHRPGTTDQGFSGTHTAYFFFTGTSTGGRYCHIVVEGTAGVYFHMHFGTMEKAGDFSGGAYMAASTFGSLGTRVHWIWEFSADISVNTEWIRDDDHYNSVGQSTDAGVSEWFEHAGMAGQIGGTQNMEAPLYQSGLQSFNQRTPFSPIWLRTWNSLAPTAASTTWKLVGHVPDVRFCSMDGREPGEVITIGADDWRIFPMHRKTTDGVSTTSSAYTNTNTGGGAPNNDSNLMGLAYREVA